MSKIVRVNNGDYKIQVQTGGTITLDSGARTGQVIITGSLDVQGSLTYLDTTNTQITDNIIVLNKGESHNYVSLQYSGIEIDRGTNNTYGNAQIVFDEKTTIDGDGTIALRYTIGGTYIPLETNKIQTVSNPVIDGHDLTLLPGVNSGVVTVAGTSNYAARVVDNDTLTNKKYVDDFVAYYFSTHFQNQLVDIGDTKVIVNDSSNPLWGLPSEIGFVIDSTTKAKVNPSGFTVDNTININSNVITNLSNSSNLKLVPTNGTLELQGYLVVTNKTTTPTTTLGASTIYTKASEGAGRSGIYFVNNTPNADELVSRNRALLWAMLF
jgi:hypothetical protein